MKDLLKSTFNEVYLLATGEEYNFVNKKVDKQLDNFLKHIPEGVGEDWLLNFTIFQFSYYDGMKTRFDRIYINWIYGDKALHRWDSRTDAQIYYANLFRERIGIKPKQPILNVKTWRDQERCRFENSNRQLLHCDELMLFDKVNVICITCKMYEKCAVQVAEVSI